MPLIRWRWVPLALEDMAQVPSTVAAYDLCPLHAESSIHMPRHCARHSVIERWPSAARLELLLRGVERCVASGAIICALRWSMLVVFAGVRGLSALLAEDAELLCAATVSDSSI